METVTVDPNTGDVTIVGVNPRGTWKRTMMNKGSETSEMVTADSEVVQALAHWSGDLHHSSYTTKMYGGGVFSSVRGVEGGSYYCETVFTPENEKKGRRAEVRWEFERMAEKKK